MSLEGIAVTQKELEEIWEHQHEIAWREKRLADLRFGVHALLSAGADVEPGRFEAYLKLRIGRPVPWKQIAVEFLDPSIIDSIKNKYGTNVFNELVVVEHAALPLWGKGDRDPGADGKT